MRAVRLVVAAVTVSAVAGGGILGACGLDAAGTAEPVPSSPIDGGADVVSSLPDAGSDAAFDATDATSDAPIGCPTGLRGPALVRILDGGHCIDSTEVTNADYDAFLTATNGGSLEAGAPEDGLPAQCAALTTFARKTADPATAGPNVPVTHVTWCDAFAYCTWAGKRLCGKPARTDIDAGTEWYQACSNDGTRDYPYPGKDPGGGVFAYDGGSCNANNLAGAGGKPLPVASKPFCEGGIPGLFDMSGNVEEYIDGCNGTQCPAAGGGYYARDSDARCKDKRFVDSTNLVLVAGEGSPGDGSGIRCCADVR